MAEGLASCPEGVALQGSGGAAAHLPGLSCPPRLILLPSLLWPQPESKCRRNWGGRCSPVFQKNNLTTDSRSPTLGKVANSPGLGALPCEMGLWQ